MSKGLSKEDTKQDHPLQAILLCDAWGEEARWGPLVRRARTDDEEFEGLEITGEKRPWVSRSSWRAGATTSSRPPPCSACYRSSTLLSSRGHSSVCQQLEWSRSLSLCATEWRKSARGSGPSCSRLLRHQLTSFQCSTSSYNSSTSPLSIIIRPTKAMTPGDVLREVDGLGILAPADFLVVQAGYVGNVDLGEKVKEFAARRAASPMLSMSCVIAPRKHSCVFPYVPGEGWLITPATGRRPSSLCMSSLRTTSFITTRSRRSSRGSNRSRYLATLSDPRTFPCGQISRVSASPSAVPRCVITSVHAHSADDSPGSASVHGEL